MSGRAEGGLKKQAVQRNTTSYRSHHRVPAGMHPLSDGLQTDALR